MTKFVLLLVLVFVSTFSQSPDKMANGIENPTTISVTETTCPICECSVTRHSRIVGGTRVKKVNQYPWIALLNASGGTCGGSLINSRYILTAAHCVYGLHPSEITVRLMEHDLSVGNESITMIRNVNHIVIPKNYNDETYEEDIALLRLDRTAIQGISLNEPSPICLAQNDNDTFAGKDGLIIGWGVTQATGSMSNVLQEVKVPIISNDKCLQIYAKGITSKKLCALFPEGGKDACQGDSGGPMMVEINSKYYLVGIVSWGVGCAGSTHPGVYTRVSHYIDWIANNTADVCPCPYPPSISEYKTNEQCIRSGRICEMDVPTDCCSKFCFSVLRTKYGICKRKLSDVVYNITQMIPVPHI